jgi:hypothetical protein
MIVKSEEERRIAREMRQKARAASDARRQSEAKDQDARAERRFAETRALFGRNVAYWNAVKDQPPRLQTLRVHRDALHKRILWSAGDALNWKRREDGTYYLDEREIDRLHKPMALLLQFVKAEHKIAQDRAAHALRERQAGARAAKDALAMRPDISTEIAGRPHTPELSG